MTRRSERAASFTDPGPTDSSLALQAMLAEYQSLREESMAAIEHRMLATNFIFAALTVTTGALLGGNAPAYIAGLILLVGLPQLAKAGLLIWLGEYERSQRAGRHLRGLEQRINALVDGPALSWESSLVSTNTHMRYPYAAVVGLLLGAGVIAGLGGVASLWWLDPAPAPGPWWCGLLMVGVIGLVEGLFIRRFMQLWRRAKLGD